MAVHHTKVKAARRALDKALTANQHRTKGGEPMDKIKVRYEGGQSRHGTHAVDYMLAEADGVELYAEAAPVEGDETGTYETLRREILAQAQERGIDPARLQFD